MYVIVMILIGVVFDFLLYDKLYDMEILLYYFFNLFVVFFIV